MIEVGQKHSDGQHTWEVAQIRRRKDGSWSVSMDRKNASLTLHGRGDIETSKAWNNCFGKPRGEGR